MLLLLIVPLPVILFKSFGLSDGSVRIPWLRLIFEFSVNFNICDSSVAPCDMFIVVFWLNVISFVFSIAFWVMLICVFVSSLR